MADADGEVASPCSRAGRPIPMTNLDTVSTAASNMPNCHINLVRIPEGSFSRVIWRGAAP